MKVVVVNLATGEEKTYNLSPEQAVVAAYAQGKGDWNTWDYGKRYKIIRGNRTVACGDWVALLQG